MERRAPLLSREPWERHPRYPRQTLLLGSHDNFLAINDRLIERAGRVPELDALEPHYRYWIHAMRSHERYEELKLYPYLEHRFGVSFEPSRAGHAELHEKHAAVLAAFRGVDASDDARAALVDALTEHRATLHAHLTLEEMAVIPLLLELSPEEFERYYALPLSKLVPTSLHRET